MLFEYFVELFTCCREGVADVLINLFVDLIADRPSEARLVLADGCLFQSLVDDVEGEDGFFGGEGAIDYFADFF